MADKMNAIQHQPADDVKEGDIYYTPNSLARDLIAHTPIKDGQSVLDPAKGLGAFYDNLPTDNKDWAEISEGSDFYAITEKYHWLVTNPPFSNFKKWLIKSCTLATVGFAYIIPTHGLTENRIKACAELGFNITDMIFFKNPKEWGLGFQMVWVVWQKTEAANIRILGHPTGCQTSLNEWLK